eukprot:g51736.t1
MAQAEEIRTETGPLDYDYTEKEVELCQENLQNHKACSPHKIKNEMLKVKTTSPSPRDLSRTFGPRLSFDWMDLQHCVEASTRRGHWTLRNISSKVRCLAACVALINQETELEHPPAATGILTILEAKTTNHKNVSSHVKRNPSSP